MSNVGASYSSVCGQVSSTCALTSQMDRWGYRCTLYEADGQVLSVCVLVSRLGGPL